MVISGADNAVIWDMDGVIVDSGPFHFLAWRDVVIAKGRPFTQDDFRRGFGMRNDAILNDLFGPLASEEIDLLSEKKERAFRAALGGNAALLPGVLDLLEIQRQLGFGIAIGSSAPRENIDFVLAALAISDYFTGIVSAENVTVGKPDPQCFLLAAEGLGIAPQRCIVIEDATAGVEAAKSAGMKCIAVTNTHSSSALAKADLVTDNLEKINGEDLERLLSIG